MKLRGLGIQDQHIAVEILDQEAFIQPVSPNCHVIINGVHITKKTPLAHMVQVQSILAVTDPNLH